MSRYTRFVIVTAGRTGSTWLVDALGSHDEIVCFGSVFEVGADYVSFDVEGYDNFDARDRALRDTAPVKFLRQRIFGQHHAGVRAVGFKFQYRNWFGFPGLLEHLVADPQLKVIHLRRRNLLRALVSLRLAQMSGQYHRQSIRLGWRRIGLAVRHPARAIQRLRVRLAARHYAPPGLVLTSEECQQFFMRTKLTEAHYDNLFAEHERIEVLYEDMAEDFGSVSDKVQEFLGVTGRTLGSRHQPLNVAPTRQLMSNCDELYEAFKDTPHAVFFD